MTESELLFSELLNYSREKLYLNKNYQLNPVQARFLADALKRRLKGEPIQYILGKVDFMGLDFRLTPDVFIPRPETEILVETAIRIVRSSKFSRQNGIPPSATTEFRHRRKKAGLVHSILDIGTGSGCIAISLAKFLPGAEIVAADISGRALEIARQNALLNNVGVNFLRSNLFESLPICDMRYAICVCNPPYIPRAEIVNLQPELDYEPRIALDGGRDGLYFYRRIIQQAPAYLKKGGFLILEIGFNQCPAIKELFKSVGKFKIVEVVKDYSDIDRVIVAQSV